MTYLKMLGYYSVTKFQAIIVTAVLLELSLNTGCLSKKLVGLSEF